MNNEINSVSKNNSFSSNNDKIYTLESALKEFDELKNIALSCLDKNGNPNIAAAMRAVENKVKISGLYNLKTLNQQVNVVKMTEIMLDGEQLKLNIGEEFNEL